MNDNSLDYRRLKAFLDRLSEKIPIDRVSLLNEMFTEDPALADRVQSMLSLADPDDEFFEGSIPDLLAVSVDAGYQRQAGSLVGPFELDSVLGEGGMGIVYRALQHQPVERVVALKLISTHATQNQRYRFERESMVLARLAHPNVAMMYQSGISDTGEPYVAMEYVDGLPISEWCQQYRMPAKQRIELFLGACRGISHAHEKGVLHRDIKSTNILVKNVDGVPIAKVIDFGIAGWIDSDATNTRELTRDQLLGTPAYMSPESIHVSDRTALDARSDVYSLGVVLFELLVGCRPHDTGDLPLAEFVKLMSTVDAPSAARVFANTDEDDRQRFAQEMRSTPREIERMLRPEIDAILHKALALDPKQRYASSLEFGDDIQRHLSGDVVLAHPPGKIYVGKKLIRRHWLGLSATLILVIMLAAGLIARSIEVTHTKLALQESLAMSDFMVNLIGHASQRYPDGREITLQNVIEQAVTELDERFAGQPKVRERVLHTLGRVFAGRGQYQRSAKLLQEALDINGIPGQGNDLDTTRLLLDLGTVLFRLQRMDEAKRILQRGLVLAKVHVDEEPLLSVAFMEVLRKIDSARKSGN